MRKLFGTLVLSLLAALPGAAAPNFNFTIPTPTVTVGQGGTVVFGYQVQNTSTAGETLLLSNLGFNVNFTGMGVETDLFDIITVNAGQTATGNLFRVAVLPTAPVGPYAFVASLTVQFDDEFFSSLEQSRQVTINVQAVPEPATAGIAGLALAAAAVAIRRRGTPVA